MSTLTLIFVFLKLSEEISWSWWLVFLPTIIEVVLSIVYCVVSIWANISRYK